MLVDVIPLGLASALIVLVTAASRVQGRREPTPAAGALSAAQRDDLLLTLAAWGAFVVVLLLGLAQMPRLLVIAGLVPALPFGGSWTARGLDRLGSRTLVELKVAAALGLAACGFALWMGN